MLSEAHLSDDAYLAHLSVRQTHFGGLGNHPWSVQKPSALITGNKG